MFVLAARVVPQRHGATIFPNPCSLGRRPHSIRPAERYLSFVNILILLVVLLLVFGGGGFYFGGPVIGGGGFGLILLIGLII